MKTTATVHSYHEGQAIVAAELSNGEAVQAMVNGVTVELVDANGSAHTHRFTDVEAARAVFGVVGTKLEITYEAVDVPEVEAPAEIETSFESDASSGSEETTGTAG